MKNNIDLGDGMEFDYIIVGGGSGGATLAGRLSEDPQLKICLIEAGGDGRGILVRAPAGVVAMVPGRPKINNSTAAPEMASAARRRLTRWQN
jgi:choline dehydrogenase-like flavoprotein